MSSMILKDEGVPLVNVLAVGHRKHQLRVTGECPIGRYSHHHLHDTLLTPEQRLIRADPCAVEELVLQPGISRRGFLCDERQEIGVLVEVCLRTSISPSSDGVTVTYRGRRERRWEFEHTMGIGEVQPETVAFGKGPVGRCVNTCVPVSLGKQLRAPVVLRDNRDSLKTRRSVALATVTGHDPDSNVGHCQVVLESQVGRSYRHRGARVVPCDQDEGKLIATRIQEFGALLVEGVGAIPGSVIPGQVSSVEFSELCIVSRIEAFDGGHGDHPS